MFVLSLEKRKCLSMEFSNSSRMEAFLKSYPNKLNITPNLFNEITNEKQRGGLFEGGKGRDKLGGEFSPICFVLGIDFCSFY